MSNEGKSLQSTEPKKIDAKSGEKEKALSLVVGQIERNFGKGSVSYTHLTLPTIYSV